MRRGTSGLGLFADGDIRRNDFIIEYYGFILILESSMTGRYLFEVSKRKVVDGSPRYNKARYINHSCRPNCRVSVVKGKIYIYAKRNIRAGEELAYVYGKEYFNEFIKPHGCRCLKCAGVK